jgi:hypothetical protein
MLIMVKLKIRTHVVELQHLTILKLGTKKPLGKTSGNVFHVSGFWLELSSNVF